MGKLHKSHRGQMVDMTALLETYKDEVAVGNASLNTSGDMLGSGGTVIKDHNTIEAEYRKLVASTVGTSSLKNNVITLDDIEFETPTEAVARIKQEKQAAKEKAAATAPEPDTE